MNCWSLRNKTSEVTEHLESASIDVCLLQETFMKEFDTAIINELKECGLVLFSLPRTSREHGGLGIVYKDALKVKPVKQTKSQIYKTFEFVEATMKTTQGLLRFCNIYRPPYSVKHRYTITDFFPEFKNYLETLVNKSGIPLILGDFNIHIEKEKETSVIAFNNLIKQFCFEQLVSVKKPTHKNGGTLDLILAQSNSLSCTDANVYPDGTSSDHYLVSTDIHCFPDKIKKDISPSFYRNFNTIDVISFKEDLRSSNLCNLELLHSKSDDIDYVTDLYKSELTKLLDKHCPVQRKKPSLLKKERDKWFDCELTDLRQRLRAAERKWYKSKITIDKENYKVLKKSYTAVLKLKRMTYHSTSLINMKSDKRKLFSKLNKLIGKEDIKLPECSDNKQLANDFIKYFETKISSIRLDIDRENTDILKEDVISVDGCNNCHFQNTDSDLKQFTALSMKDLIELISAMSPKFCSLDPIPTWLVKECLDDLGPILLMIVNLSLKKGIFPACLKAAIVKPTIKDFSVCSDTLSNYRPVSNIPFLSKVIEKAVLEQLNTHLKLNNLYCSNQSGYRQHHSCETLNVRMFNDMLKSVDENNIVALFLLDMSSAFDTIDHSLLIALLQESYGINSTALNWFVSYLENRTWSVNIENSFSNILTLMFGVPQDSILGPVLFILYTKHVQHIAFKYGLQIHLYADDTQLFIAFKPLDDLSGIKNNIENCMFEIKSWMCSKYLKLNEGKTKLIFITKPAAFSSIYCGNFNIETANGVVEVDWKNLDGEIKTLGVRLDPYLEMSNHITYVKKYCVGQLMSWKRVAPLLTEDVKLMLVKQIILAKLDYNNSLFTGLPLSVIENLQSIINCCIRFIYNLQWHDHITPHLIKSHILPVRFRIDYKVCMLVFNCLHGLAPSYLQCLLKWNVPKTCYGVFRSGVGIPRRTQDPYLLHIPTDFGNRTRYRSRAFSHYAPKCWNSLPYKVRCCENKDTLKTELKTYYYELFLQSYN